MHESMRESNQETARQRAAVRMQWRVKIPLRDGVHLHATIYLPSPPLRPAPVIFTHTPYVGQTYHDQAHYFAEHGYPFLTVDVRGRGNSEGEFHPANEAKDGYDVVEWIATQPYCNGKVAMWGGSYSGYAQWAVAKEFPPHLATIVPVASPCRGVDSPMRNNFFSPYLMRWLTYLSGRCAQDKIFADQSFWNHRFKEWFVSGRPFKALDTFLDNPSPLFQEWISHPQRGEYWDRYNPTAKQYSDLAIPILTITGIYDGDQPGALAHHAAHMQNADAAMRVRHFLIIGPWDHAGTRTPKAEFCGVQAGPASLLDLQKLHREWYAWTMQEGAKPEFLKKNVAYYVMVADQWRYVDSLEAVTARSAPFYLASTCNPTDVFKSGSLNTHPPLQSHADHYIYDPRDVSLAELESTVDPESRADHRMIYASVGKRLIYHSAPFDRDTEVSGFFKLTAWLSIDQPDTDFSAAVYDIDLDGKATLLSNDLRRARYRTSLRQAELIATRDSLRYEFDQFMFVSRLIKQGHRLRLVIGPVNSIFMQKNHNTGGVVAEESVENARAVTVQLFHDEVHPSALYVPFAHAQTDAAGV